MQEEEKVQEEMTCPKCGKTGSHLFKGVFVCEGLKDNEVVEGYGEAKANRDLIGNTDRRALRSEKY